MQGLVFLLQRLMQDLATFINTRRPLRVHPS